jgi:hypothetical protein
LPEKIMPDQEQLVPMTFPTYGINLITEFELQLPNTTPIGSNVRGYEPATGRDRGGSRAGLSKWIDSPVNGIGAALIQDLNVLVLCNGSALLTSFPLDLFGDNVPNPNFPQWDVPAQGSGVQLNRNTGSTGGSTNAGFAGITTISGSGPTYTSTFKPDVIGQTATVMSGTGTIASGVGFIAVQVSVLGVPTYFIQPPVFAS